MKLFKENKGFTIIEVLIVLAIAGLIMVIVFLAVPALQRNNRNTARTSDASRLLGAINECTANNNGVVSSCVTAAQLDPAYITMANNQQLTSLGAAPSISAAFINTGAGGFKCDTANAATGGGGARAFAVTYLVETANGTAPRCIAS